MQSAIEDRPVGAQAPAGRWEYTVIQFRFAIGEADMGDQLTEYGREGWRVIKIESMGDRGRFVYLERLLP